MAAHRRSCMILLTVAVASALGAAGAGAQQLFIYPQRGQSPQQQQQDRFECHQWAVQQTGFDPMMGTAPPPPAPAPTTGAVRGAARGAALGAVGGAIGGNAGRGAAIGAGHRGGVRDDAAQRPDSPGPGAAIGPCPAFWPADGDDLTGRSPPA